VGAAILGLFSQKEGHWDLEEYLLSATFKSSIFTILNSGFILLYIEIRVKEYDAFD